MSKKRLQPNSEDQVVSRESCLSTKNSCGICPNHDFKASFEKVRDTSDVDVLIDRACNVVGARVRSKAKRIGSCCTTHPDCLLLEYHIKLGKESTFDKKTASTIYDMIMESVKGVEHVRVARQEATFDLTIALRRD